MLCSYSNQHSMLLVQEVTNRSQNLERNGKLFYEGSDVENQRGNDGSFDKSCWENDFYMKKIVIKIVHINNFRRTKCLSYRIVKILTRNCRIIGDWKTFKSVSYQKHEAQKNKFSYINIYFSKSKDSITHKIHRQQMGRNCF